MESWISIAVVVGGAGVVLLIQWLVARASASDDGMLWGNAKRRGAAATGLRAEFTAPVAGEELVAHVLETLGISDGRRVQGLKVAGASDDGGSVMIESGNATVTHVTFAIDTDPAEGGCQGFACAVQWQEHGGHVTNTEAIERLHRHVRSAVTHFGGRITEAKNDLYGGPPITEGARTPPQT